MGRRLSVKDKSVYEFLKEHICCHEDNRTGSMMNRENINPYYLMKNEMHFKKSPDINVGDAVEFQLFDRSANSNKELLNTYIYDVVEYDDVCVLLKLVNFRVEVVEPE